MLLLLNLMFTENVQFLTLLTQTNTKNNYNPDSSKEKKPQNVRNFNTELHSWLWVSNVAGSVLVV